MQNVLGILESLLGQVALPLDLDVEGGGDVRDEDVDELADPEHHMLEDDHERELDRQDLPVHRREESLVVTEPAVETFWLKYFSVLSKIFLHIINMFPHNDHQS